jgi:lipoprotein NlpD
LDFQRLARVNRLSSPYILRVGQRLRLDIERAVDVTPGKPYTVQGGDTLYGIAFALGMDFRELATLNGISPPYTITVGQTLRTHAPRPKQQTSKKPSTTKTPAPSNRRAQPAPSQSIPTTATTSATTTKPPITAKPTDERVSPPTPVSTAPVSAWRWPVAGAVVRRFSANHHKGIDIDGRRGETVRAVAGGTVVYAGTGVKGYGALVIVKHNDVFLSAYGHNDAMLVKEGAQVKPGQAIASMGSSGTDAVKLHLEIRKNGKPIDPLSVLPVRR